MSFKEEIDFLENVECDYDILYKKGSIPILFTAPHTMMQTKENGDIKLNEPYTKALALYMNKYFHAYTLIKVKDTGLDPNRDNHDEFKTLLYDLVKNENIKLVIDLHGASKSREFDVELGTLNNLTAEYSTVKELVKSFENNGITNVAFNEPFKGGAITQYLYNIKEVDVIQLEINYKYRDSNNLSELERLTYSLGHFINRYIYLTKTRERKLNVSLYEPLSYKDYWYLKRIQEDPKTMSYNAGYDISVEGYNYDTGCIELPEEKWESKYNSNKERNIYIAYVKDNDSGEFVGYVTYHLNKEENRYYCGVLIEDLYRGRGYSRIALELLIEKAKMNNISSLYDSFEESRMHALPLFSEVGFKQVEAKTINKFGKSEKSILVSIDL